MILSKIKIKNFRNYENEEILFSNNINYILGDNAQGKTNLLESIFFILNGESFKNIKEEELFNQKLNLRNFKIELEILHEERKNKITIEKKDNKKEYFINGIKKKL